MANSKISALTSATTPLAGTETLPIVQSNATVKVPVSDLTAGRAVSALSYTAAVPNNAVFQTAAAFTNSTNADLLVRIKTSVTDIGPSTSTPLTISIGLNEIGRFTTTGFAPINGNGIDFSATPGTGTSELLADYEEGTWTPNLGGTEVLASVVGTYTKIGRQVTVSFSYTVTTIGTGSTQTISGLPFTTSSLTSGGSVTYFANSVTSVTSIILRTNASATTLQITSLTTLAGTTVQNVDINQNGTIFNGTVTYFV